MTKRRNSSENIVEFIFAQKDEQTIFLNRDKSSWIKVRLLDDNIGLNQKQFDELWLEKPKDRLKLSYAGLIIQAPRFSTSYLKPYVFSGLNHEANLKPPKIIQELLAYCKQTNPDLNQSLVNWYEYNGSIGKHSDDTKQLKLNSDIYSLSFGNAERTFILEPRINSNNYNTTYKIALQNNIMIIMGGQCQKSHIHYVPKNLQDKSNGKRINVTFRCFK